MSLFDKIRPYKNQLALTLLAYLGCGLFAFRSQSIGACLLEFEIQIQEPFVVTSRVFGVYSIGYTAGVFLYGLIEKLSDVRIVSTLACIFAGIAIGSMAFMRSFISLASMAFFLGFGNSTYELACHVLLINTWSDKVGNFIQILHMCYGLGSMLAPTLIRLFLLPIPKDISDDKDAARKFYSPDDIQIKYPFVVTCALSIIVGFGFGFSYLKRPKNVQNFNNDQEKKVTEESDPHDVKKFEDQPSNMKICIAVTWVAILGHLGFALQLTLCSFAQAFGVKHSFNMEKKSAALLSSLFWAFYVISKLIFVILSMTIGQGKILNICCAITAVALALLLFLASQFEVCLWLAFGLLGLGYSPLFAVAYASLEKYFHVTGRQTSFIFLIAGIGESLHPTIVGTLMDDNPCIFLYYVGTLGVVFLAMLICLPHLCRFLFGGSDDKKFQQHVLEIQTKRLSSVALPPSSLFRGSFSDLSPTDISQQNSSL